MSELALPETLKEVLTRIYGSKYERFANFHIVKENFARSSWHSHPEIHIVSKHIEGMPLLAKVFNKYDNVTKIYVEN